MGAEFKQGARRPFVAVDVEPDRAAPFGTIVLMVLASALYVTMLTTVSFSAGGGNAIVGQGLESFFFTLALWIALAFLVVAGAVAGQNTALEYCGWRPVGTALRRSSHCRHRHVLTPYQMGCHRTGVVAATDRVIFDKGALRKTPGRFPRQWIRHLDLGCDRRIVGYVNFDSVLVQLDSLRGPGARAQCCAPCARSRRAGENAGADRALHAACKRHMDGARFGHA